MNYEVGSILLAEKYQLPTSIKDKFFIIIGHTNDNYNLLSMTTSQIYFSQSIIKHGLIEDRDLRVYCFLANKVIGRNGFAFRKNTIVSQRNNIHQFSADKINKCNMILQDVLIDEELVNLVYSFLTYKGTLQSHKSVLDNLLIDKIGE